MVNDAAEHALGFVTEKNTPTTPKSEEQLQALYKVVKGVREKLAKLNTSSESVVKKHYLQLTMNGINRTLTSNIH